MAHRPEKPQQGFSSKKLNELLDLTRAANRHGAGQLEAIRALSAAIDRHSARPILIEDREVPASSERSLLSVITNVVSLVAAVATVIGLIAAAWSIHLAVNSLDVAVDSLEVAVDSSQRAAISQTYYAPMQFCSTAGDDGKMRLEGGEVFSIFTNTGRLPITVTGIRGKDDPDGRDLDFSIAYVDQPGVVETNRPFTIEVGQAVAVSILYGAELGTLNKDGSFSQSLNTQATILLSDGTTVVPPANPQSPAPELIRSIFRTLTQLTCDVSRYEFPYHGDTKLFPESQTD